MNKSRSLLLAALLFPASHLVSHAQAEPAPAASRPLLDAASDGVEKRVGVSSGQVSVARSADAAAPGVVVTIQPGPEGYPGINLTPADGGAWDLSAFGGVEAKVVNTGARQIPVSLRVDNAGDWKTNPWNGNTIYVKPGETGTVRVLFGYSYGKPGFALNAAKVVKLLLMTGKTDAVQTFRIESIEASGVAGEKPPVDPESVRVKPAYGGVLVGELAAVDAAKQLTTKAAQATVVSGKHSMLKISFPAAKEEQSVSLKPAIGRWDLRDALELRIKLKNDGSAAFTPRVRVESNGGPSDWVSAPAPLAAGAVQELVVPFVSAKIWNNKKDGVTLASQAVSRVIVATEPADTERTLTVQSIVADLPPAPALPDWLGKRPPVPGDWVKTFDDEFDGAAVDETKWNITGPNYWDKQSHWSKENVIVGGGVVRLRYTKKTGFQNDDPKEKQTDYASGFLQTYGKWTQRYGYFEARMKLPTAPGLWPAFWTMPDRGAEPGSKGGRQSTSDGGMEFDIMEYLSVWGPYRYNIAMHWDGYGKEHKSLGSDKIYFQPDKDGFVTAGLLWTPGSAIYYCNGREVLRFEDARISNVPAEMMFTLPQGGWDNNTLDETKLPDEFVIDYVRCWQRGDLAAPAAGAK